MKLPVNPWDSLMVCGFSWWRAKHLIKLYAEKEGIEIRRYGKGYYFYRWDKRKSHAKIHDN